MSNVENTGHSIQDTATGTEIGWKNASTHTLEADGVRFPSLSS